jgi:hypothetical protein
MAADFFVVPTATGRLMFVLVLLAHQRHHVVHVAVTAHPTAAWTAQQFREAFPWGEAPRYLLRDRDLADNRRMITITATELRAYVAKRLADGTPVRHKGECQGKEEGRYRTKDWSLTPVRPTRSGLSI